MVLGFRSEPLDEKGLLESGCVIVFVIKGVKDGNPGGVFDVR